MSEWFLMWSKFLHSRWEKIVCVCVEIMMNWSIVHSLCALVIFRAGIFRQRVITTTTTGCKWWMQLVIYFLKACTHFSMMSVINWSVESTLSFSDIRDKRKMLRLFLHHKIFLRQGQETSIYTIDTRHMTLSSKLSMQKQVSRIDVIFFGKRHKQENRT